MDFQKISSDVETLLYEYISNESFTNSYSENKVKDFFNNLFKDEEYFKKNPSHVGFYDIENDCFNRSVCYAMVKGKGNDAVVLIHHYDVVGVEDYKGWKDYAFSPQELHNIFNENQDILSGEALNDLKNNEFIFGRGSADMKGGGSIQLTLLREYSRQQDFQGNVIVIAVPDEENLSAGMRSAVKLLETLKLKYNFNYMMMINSEPHQRKDNSVGIFSEGSVGKMMPFAYVRGYLSHAGKVFEGFNPSNLLAEIVRLTEMNMDFADVVGNEAAPPPTWLYLKDSKVSYDVSMPLSAMGCLSVLTLNSYPEDLMDSFKLTVEKAFHNVLDDMNQSYGKFLSMTDRPVKELPWQVKVVNFSELCEEATVLHGDVFKKAYDTFLENLIKESHSGNFSMIEMNNRLIDEVYNYISDLSPRVVVGLLPPYYPNVSNKFMDQMNRKCKNLSEVLNQYTMKSFNQKYTKEYFYTGISDLSYINIINDEVLTDSLKANMPLFGKYYDIPFKAIKYISMPGINIGPWGKDFHKISERVNREDLCVRTPRILDYAIRYLLNREGEEV